MKSVKVLVDYEDAKEVNFIKDKFLKINSRIEGNFLSNFIFFFSNEVDCLVVKFCNST